MSAARISQPSADGASFAGDGKGLLLSVVVPAHRTAALLERSLAALVASDIPRDSWELLVVDDASDDESSRAAGRHADVVIRLPLPARGPSYARNRGFELTRGRFVAFVNADVEVRPDTLRGLLDRLAADPALVAVSATYDAARAVPGFVSRYRNLVRHWEQRATPSAQAELWAGCCAVRPAAFASVGMFNEWHFARPSIEAAELTARLRTAGGGVRVAHDLPVTHLRDFTLHAMLRDDVHLRRFEHARLLAGRGGTSAGPPIRAGRAALACEALVWAAIACLAVAAVVPEPEWTVAAGSLLLLAVVLDGPLYGFLARTAGVLFAIAVVPLRLLSHAIHGLAHLAGSLLRHTVGEPRPDPTIEAWVEIGVETWPPVPAKRLPATPGGQA